MNSLTKVLFDEYIKISKRDSYLLWRSHYYLAAFIKAAPDDFLKIWLCDSRAAAEARAAYFNADAIEKGESLRYRVICEKGGLWEELQ